MNRAMLAAIAIAALVGPASAAKLPPVPGDLLGKTAVACVRVNDGGAVTDAFIITSSGDAAIDGEMVVWVKQLHWDPATEGDENRNRWFPIGLAFGGVAAPPSPQTCKPPADLGSKPARL